MNQEQRAQVWARKIELARALDQLPQTDKDNIALVKTQIEACNQALVQNKIELMPQPENEADT